MKLFLISDTHFFHKNIIKYCDRGFNSVEEMNKTLIDKWNSKVNKEDIVIHLGDFALADEDNIIELRKKLNGTIILIEGNHDWRLKEDYGFIIIKGNMQVGNIILSHRPIPLEELPKGIINIFGHIHQKEVLDSTRQINLSVEKTNYEPIELSKVCKLLK